MAQVVSLAGGDRFPVGKTQDRRCPERQRGGDLSGTFQRGQQCWKSKLCPLHARCSLGPVGIFVFTEMHSPIAGHRLNGE